MATLPNPRTLSNERLADLYGSISAKKAELDAQLKTLGRDFMRRGFAVVDGKRYRLTRVEAASYTTLNSEQIRQVMDTDWLERFSKPVHKDAYCLVKAITKTRITKPVKAAPKQPARVTGRALETVH